MGLWHIFPLTMTENPQFINREPMHYVGVLEEKKKTKDSVWIHQRLEGHFRDRSARLQVTRHQSRLRNNQIDRQQADEDHHGDVGMLTAQGVHGE